MSKSTPKTECTCPPSKSGSSGGAVYGLGVIGALFYFFTTASQQSEYLLAIPKAIFWPALLVYHWLRQYGL